MIRKRLVSVLLLLTLLSLTLLACSKPATPAPQPTAAPTTTAAPKPTTAAPPATTAAPKPTTTAPAPSPTAAVKPIVLRGETTLPKAHDINVLMKQLLAEIETRSGGRIKFDISEGGALADARTVQDAVANGAIDWSHGSYAWFTGKNPVFELSAMPFAFKDVADQFKGFHSTPLGGLLQKYLDKFNMVGLDYYNSGPNVLLTTKKQVKVLEDIKGLKLRGPGGASDEAIKFLGGIPVSVISSEAYPSLEKGIIDGAYFGYYTLESYKLIDLIKYANEINLDSAIINSFLFNKDTWKKIPPDLQKLMQDAMKESEAITIKHWADSTAKYREMAVKAGIQITSPDATEIARWRQLGGVPVWESVANRVGGEDGAALIKALKDWHGIK